MADVAGAEIGVAGPFNLTRGKIVGCAWETFGGAEMILECRPRAAAEIVLLWNTLPIAW
jgi:hypothetical protein